MHIRESIIEGIKILGFNSKIIKRVGREKDLEEIFLSTIFFNYLLMLILFFINLALGGFKIAGRELNQTVVFAFMMIYPFIYNLKLYIYFGILGYASELLEKSKTIKPLISVGFHIGVVYTLIFVILGIIFFINPNLGIILYVLAIIHFLIISFVAVSKIYKFSFNQTLIVIFIPILIWFLIVLVLGTFVNMSFISNLLFL